MKNNFASVLDGLMIETATDTNKLAACLGVTVQSVNNWRRGSRGDMSLSTLIAICNFFGCSLDYLVGLTDQDKKTNKIAFDNFGKRVREIMKIKGITTYRIRKETRFGGNHFHDWNNGADPKLSTLIELAGYFKCSLDELVGLE